MWLRPIVISTRDGCMPSGLSNPHLRQPVITLDRVIAVAVSSFVAVTGNSENSLSMSLSCWAR